jgi:hypothetical protein
MNGFFSVSADIGHDKSAQIIFIFRTRLFAPICQV